MKAASESCAVALPMPRNCATSPQPSATTGATSAQPISLKALAIGVLQRNSQRNQCATDEENHRNTCPENPPQKLRSCEGGCTVATITTAIVTKPTLPSWCRADCSCLEVIEGLGPGCVQQLAAGPWWEEWHRLDKIKACPGNSEIKATSYPCGKCGYQNYTRAGGGWRCDGCKAFFEIIGGTAGPNIRQRTDNHREKANISPVSFLPL